MHKAQASLAGVLVAGIGVMVVLSFMLENSSILKNEREAYEKAYNRAALSSILSYRNYENISVQELIAARACNDSAEINITGLIKKIIKPRYNYIFNAGGFADFSSEPYAVLESISPATIVVSSYCKKDTITIFGAFT